MHPSGFVAKNYPAIDYRRTAPDRTARLILPNHFALVRGQAIEVMVAAADVDLSVPHDRAGPNANVFTGPAQMGAVSSEVPNQLARFLLVAADHSIFGC